MLSIDARSLAATLPYADLIDALDASFRGDSRMPARTHHEVAVREQPAATLLVMPAWQEGRALGIKIATVFPGNAAHGLPAVNASYLLLDPNHGTPLAIMDGTELTLRRTAAASALASRYLSRSDAHTLLMVGTGKLAPHTIAAHATARSLRRVLIWGRNVQAAKELAGIIDLPGVEVRPVGDLHTATPLADIICCATLSSEPLISGSLLRGGQHLDLVGAFTPAMSEVDGAAVRRAEVYVDTYEGAQTEAGEIVQALANGDLSLEDIRGDLRQMTRGERPGRRSDTEITLFKSVGCALEDLAAAQLAWDRHEHAARHD
jgi:ornithine cyclodeaminase